MPHSPRNDGDCSFSDNFLTCLTEILFCRQYALKNLRLLIGESRMRGPQQLKKFVSLYLKVDDIFVVEVPINPTCTPYRP